MRLKHLLLSVAALAGLATAADSSPWDRGQQEFSGAARLPVQYADIFVREREMLKYDPRFMPGMLTFSPANVPVMRVGLPDGIKPGENRQSVTSRALGRVNLIQYPDRDGRWQVTDGQIRAVRSYLKLAEDAPLEIEFGERVPDAVEFDDAGNAYTLVNAAWMRGDRKARMNFLVVSPDEFKTCEVVKLDYAAARIEPYRVNADRANPPGIAVMVRHDGKTEYALVKVYKNEAGKITVSKPIVYAPAALEPHAGLGTMAGDGAQMITRGGKTFLVFMSNLADPKQPGTAQYIVEYDHAAGTMSAPVLLGRTGHRVDGHNVPVIDIDSKGILHVIGGAHWHAFKHWRSKAPLSIAAWEAPLPVGLPEPSNRWSRDGLSYPGMLIDRNDTIHIVARGRNQAVRAKDSADHYDNRFAYEQLNYALVYLRKKANGSWETRRDLAIPAWNHYSNWYHKVAIDRENRVYCVYYYYASWLSKMPGVTEKYLKLWPADAAADGKLPDRNLRAHDPVLIGTFDGGDSWKLVGTPDLTAATKRQ